MNGIRDPQKSGWPPNPERTLPSCSIILIESTLLRFNEKRSIPIDLHTSLSRNVE